MIFAALSFAEALARAREEGRLLLVHATAAWCGPCREMERTTWRDPRLAAWLGAHALAVQVDVDAEEALAGALGVTAMPTLIAFREGQDFDRVVGYQPPGELLAWLEGVARGETALARAKREAGLEPEDVGARYAQARALLAAVEDDAATEAYAWLWAHALEHEPALAGVRGAFMAGEMGELAARHGPARARFEALRAEARRAFEADPADDGALDDWLALSRALGAEAEALAWLDGQGARAAADPRLAPVLELRLGPLLREAGRWAELGRLYRDPLGSLGELLAAAEEAAEDEDLGAELARRAPGEAAAMVRALRAAGRSREAEAVLAEARRHLPAEALERALAGG